MLSRAQVQPKRLFASLQSGCRGAAPLLPVAILCLHMGLDDPEEPASASIPCFQENVGPKDRREVLFMNALLPLPTGH